MQTYSEIERLRNVYWEYAARGFGRSKWSAANRGNQAIFRELRLKLRELLQQSGILPFGKRRILDLGCGTGEHLVDFASWGAEPGRLFGVDLLAERVRTARRQFPTISFQAGNAEALPFPDHTFDLVSAFTVFTSVLSRQMAAGIGREINRVLVSRGVVLWYDFRVDNPFNPHVRGISRAGLEQLFPGYKFNLQTVSLVPPLARRLGPLTSLLYAPLRSLPFLRTHYLGVLSKS